MGTQSAGISNPPSPLPPAVGSFCAESPQASAFVWECWLECFAAAWLLSSPLYQQGFV